MSDGTWASAARRVAAFAVCSVPDTPTGTTATRARVFSLLTDGVLYSGAFGSIVTTISGSTITSTGGTPLQN
ncbi:MAG TPA: hypothetical protein PKA82_15745 [Pyrinomonadaceae bacterium]|nr:hypothetical protein [Pyrinomonadaceae bacterium]